MREYINKPIYIDGRKIPYPVYTAVDYLEYHDGIKGEALEEYQENNAEIFETISQIMALKQSCFLLRFLIGFILGEERGKGEQHERTDAEL